MSFYILINVNTTSSNLILNTRIFVCPSFVCDSQGIPLLSLKRVRLESFGWILISLNGRTKKKNKYFNFFKKRKTLKNKMAPLLTYPTPTSSTKLSKKRRWHVTGDMWHMGDKGWTLCKISGPLLQWFGINDVLNIWRERIAESMNQSVNDGGVCKTAPAKPGLLIFFIFFLHLWVLFMSCIFF